MYFKADLTDKKTVKDLNGFFESIKTQKYEPIYAGSNGHGKIEDKEVRNCSVYKTKYHISYETDKLVVDLLNKHGFVPYIVNNSYYDQSPMWGTCEVLRYEQGGVFVPHIDTKVKENHIGTILVYPPYGLNGEYKNGELVLYTDENQTIIIDPKTFVNWTLVCLSLTIKHECKPVLSGVRYVLKFRVRMHKEKAVVLKHANYSGYVSKTEYTPVEDTKILNNLFDQRTDILKCMLETHLELTINKKIEEIQNRSHYHARRFLQSLDIDKKYGSLVLSTYYPNIICPDDLYDRDAFIFNEFAKRYKYVYITNYVYRQHVGSSGADVICEQTSDELSDFDLVAPFDNISSGDTVLLYQSKVCGDEKSTQITHFNDEETNFYNANLCTAIIFSN